MIFVLLKTVALAFVTWVGWRYIKQYVFKGPLENIPGPPGPFLQGNLLEFFDWNGWQFHKDLAASYGSVVRIRALFGGSYLYVFDPVAMNNIAVKDQDSYEPMVIEATKVIFGEGIVTTVGEQHKRQRKVLNPVFSTSHIREIIPVFWRVSNKLGDLLISKVEKGAQEIDMAHWVTRTALELVGQSILGYSFDSLTEDTKPHPFGTAVIKLVPLLSRLAPVSPLLTRMSRFGSAKFRRWLINVTPYPDLHALRDITDLMHNTSIEILEDRRKSLEEGDDALSKQLTRGKDLMSVLLKYNMGASEEDRLPDSEVLGQISALTFAAMDTTSNAISRTIHLLSIHKDVQERLRMEITEAVAKHGNLGYDELVSLPYLDAVCRETLRLYPPVAQIVRVANRDTVMPVSKPLKGLDGKTINEIHVPKGTTIFTSILSSNRNPESWGQDSFIWRPERWMSSLPESLKDANIPGVYSHMMTFNAGGRACIGFKYAQLEMKVVLAMLLRTFRFTPSDKEVYWAMSGIATPRVVGGDTSEVCLPLRVSLL